MSVRSSPSSDKVRVIVVLVEFATVRYIQYDSPPRLIFHKLNLSSFPADPHNCDVITLNKASEESQADTKRIPVLGMYVF